MIDSQDFSYSLKFPQQGDKFGLELILGQGSEAMKLSGKGTKSGDKLTGDLDMESGGSFLGVLALDGFDKEKLKKGILSGAVEIRPSDALLNSSGGSSTISGALRNLAIRLDMDTSRNKGKVTLTLLSDGETILSLGGKAENKSGGRVNPVTGTEMEEWSADMDTAGFLEKLVGSLEQAGVPDAYTSMIPAGNG